MNLLHYQVKPTIDPRIFPAATHILVWTILAYVLVAALALLIFLFFILLVHLISTATASSGTPVALTLFMIALCVFPAIYHWRFASRLRQLRSMLFLHEWSALAIAVDIFTRQTPFTKAFVGAGLLAIVGLSVDLNLYKIIAGVLLFGLSLIPHLSILWTLRVLRRAHTAASVSTQSQLTFT